MGRKELTQIVVVKGDGEDIAGRLINDAKAVALALNDVDD